MIDKKSKDFEAGVSKIKIYLKFRVVSNWRISFTAVYFSETTEKTNIADNSCPDCQAVIFEAALDCLWTFILQSAAVCS